MPEQRFQRRRRLRRRRDFLRVQGASSRTATAHFVLLVARREDQPDEPSRLGLVVTKKVGHATERNRIKRLCRECFRQWPDFVPAGIDLVVIAKSGSATMSLVEVRAEWERARPSLLRRCADMLANARARLA